MRQKEEKEVSGLQMPMMKIDDDYDDKEVEYNDE